MSYVHIYAKSRQILSVTTQYEGIIYKWGTSMNSKWRCVGMQISEVRMQNKQQVRSLAAAQGNENYLRFLR